MKFQTFYTNRPQPQTCVLDEETKWVDQSEADRAGLKYQIERFGMDSLLQRFEKTKAQFGYADTRLSKDFASLAQSYADANQYFMQLPSEIRKKFNHSAVEFYSSIESNPQKSYEEGYISKDLAVKLGVSFEPPKVDTQPVVEPSVTENTGDVTA